LRERPPASQAPREPPAWIQAALNQLTPLVYAELHQIAHRRMRQQLPGQTLQTTALVNEAYLRLVGEPGEPGTGRFLEIPHRFSTPSFFRVCAVLANW
jgi:hypothetical protein